jgi:hypothetical protein
MVMCLFCICTASQLAVSHAYLHLLMHAPDLAVLSFVGENDDELRRTAVEDFLTLIGKPKLPDTLAQVTNRVNTIYHQRGSIKGRYRL